MMTGLSGTLRRHRKQRRMTQEEVASSVGLQRSTYSRYEEGSNRPSWKILIKLADLYGIAMDDMVGRCMVPTQSKPAVRSNQPGTVRIDQEIDELEAAARNGSDGTVDAELLQRMLALFLSANSYAKEVAVLILENGQNRS